MDADELSDRVLELAARIGRVVDALPESRLGRHVAGQLVRSGTAAVPHYEEARAAESRKDFVHKMSIALKELRESSGWLRLIVRAELLPQDRMAEVLDECVQLVHVFAASVSTARRNLEHRSSSNPQSPVPTSQSPVLPS